MKRLTKRIGDHYTYYDCNILCDQCFGGCKVSQEIIDRLGALEDILENSYELSRLIETPQNGRKVTEIKDCIEREVVLKYLKSRKAHFVDDIGKGWGAGIDAAIEGIENLPAADVAPVRHGRWIEDERTHPGPGLKNNLCSVCGEIAGSWKEGLEPGRKWAYCPNCGALMDGKEDEHEAG